MVSFIFIYIYAGDSEKEGDSKFSSVSICIIHMIYPSSVVFSYFIMN